MSQAAPLTEGPLVAARKAPRRRPLVARIMLGVTLALGAYVGWQEAPREISRWYLAAALEHRTESQHHRLHDRTASAEQERARANRALSKALAWNPSAGDMYLTRSLWREEEGDYEGALNDCQRQGAAYDPFALIVRRSSLLAHLERHQEAVKEAQKVLAMSQRQSGYTATALNYVAYHRALGKIDLPQALEEIERSFGKTPPVARDAARLDTRGFVLYRMGRYREAIVDFDRAVAQVEGQIAVKRRTRSERMLRAIDYRNVELEDLADFRVYSVMYYHRSLVLQKLNRWKQANQDLRKAKELLGREPDEHLF